MKRAFVLALFFLLPLQSFAFDKIYCDSQLFDWSVWNGFGKKNRILYSLHPAMSLAETQSRVLIVKDQTDTAIIEIYPWDGIDLIVRNASKKYDLQTDKMSWFEIVFDGSPSRKLSCRLTF